MKLITKIIFIYAIFSILSFTYACSSASYIKKLKNIEISEGPIGNKKYKLLNSDNIHRLLILKQDKQYGLITIIYEAKNKDFKLGCILVYKGDYVNKFVMSAPSGLLYDKEPDTALIYLNNFKFKHDMFYRLKCQKKLNYYLRNIVR